MAKKKTHAKKAAPARKEQKSSSLGWIVAAIVVIAIIAFLVMRPATTVPEQKTETTAPTTDKTLLTESALPEFQQKCLNAIGVVPGTQTEVDGVLSVTFKNNGRTAIEGTYFEFTDADGERRFKRNSEAVQAGQTIEYSVDLNQVGTELQANVQDFILYSIEDGKACENQRRFVLNR
jgi:hypothetical protein